MRGGCGGTGGQRADQNPAASGSGELFAVLPATDERIGVAAGPVGAALERAEAMLGCAGAGEVEDGEIVRVVEVIEFRGAKDLRLLVKSGVIAEVRVGQFAEFVERNDVGDFVAVECVDLRSRDAERPPCTGVAAEICWVNVICPSSRNHNVIWTLRR